MRRYLSIFILSLLLTACRPTPLQEQQAYVFGTRVEVIVVGSDPELARQAIAAVLQEFDRLHRQYHAWKKSSLTDLNQAIAAGRPHPVDAEMAALLAEAKALGAQGKHLFDPGIGQLIQLWGFHAEEFVAVLPPEQEITRWLKRQPSISQLNIDGNLVSSSNPDVAIDFGGYLKGVALDRAAQILREQGIRNALINIGGNVMALGDKAGKKWRVGIQHPRQPGPMATLELNDGEAIGTSGDYQRYFELDGKRYTHLIDPRTAYPVDHTQAVSVLLPAGKRAGTLSDAASKPIFIAGPEDWREMAKAMEIAMVLRVDRDNRVQVSKALHQRLQFIGNPPGIEIVD
jgi:FAD:protein FMN transferase